MKIYISILIIIGSLISCSNNNENDKIITKTDSLNNNNKNDRLKIQPIDESSKDSSLVNFISKLKNIINKQDTSSLFSILDSNIVSSYGGGLYGKVDFVDNWNLKSNSKELWYVLNKAVSLGGVFEDNDTTFRMPYCQSDRFFQDTNIDWYELAVSVKPQVKVYEKNNKSSKIVGVLDYDILHVLDIGNNFIKISTTDSIIKGYVERNDIYFSAEYILILQKNNEMWKIKSFAPYD